MNHLQQSHRNHNDEMKILEKALDLSTGQGAAVTELTSVNLLHGLAQLGSGGELELGALDGGVLVEQLGDDIVVRLGHLTGGQIADETAVALSRFSLGQGQEGCVSGVDLEGGTAVTAGSGQGHGSQGQTLDEESSTEDGSGGAGRGTADDEGVRGGGGHAGGGGGGGSGDEEKSCGRLQSSGQDGAGKGDLHVHHFCN